MNQCEVILAPVSSRKVKCLIPEHYLQNMDSLGLQQLEHLEKELEQAKKKSISHPNWSQFIVEIAIKIAHLSCSVRLNISASLHSMATNETTALVLSERNNLHMNG
uniref:Uncharacterized protein n=1 Tax=Physcomitrium patens TaxID=3218 RepID=A0A2K1JUZ1_PHYPA|nr:hypothetical protein PHYPA_015114 [Physcomitrium patens]